MAANAADTTNATRFHLNVSMPITAAASSSSLIARRNVPTRDRTISVRAWVEAPPAIRSLDAGLPPGPIGYVRRIGPWLLWKAGPLEGPDARYAAVAADDLTQVHTCEIHHDRTASGHGPSGAHHDRFRSWKEDVRDHPPHPAP